MVNIDDLLRILLDELPGKHLHITSQNNQLDVVLAKQLDLPRLSLRLALFCHWNEMVRNVVKVCVAFRVRMVAYQQKNFAREFADPLPVEQVNETVIIF